MLSLADNSENISWWLQWNKKQPWQKSYDDTCDFFHRRMERSRWINWTDSFESSTCSTTCKNLQRNLSSMDFTDVFWNYHFKKRSVDEEVKFIYVPLRVRRDAAATKLLSSCYNIYERCWSLMTSCWRYVHCNTVLASPLKLNSLWWCWWAATTERAALFKRSLKWHLDFLRSVCVCVCVCVCVWISKQLSAPSDITIDENDTCIHGNCTQ